MGETISNSGIFIYLVADFSCIFLLIPILHNLKSTLGSETETLRFRIMIWTFFVYVLTDAVMVFYMEPQEIIPDSLCYLNTIINEISLMLTAFFWCLFGLARLESKRSDSMKFKGMIALPMIALMILSISSVHTGLIFTIDMEGMYHRGPLFFVQAAVIYIYNLAIPAAAVHRITYSKSRTEKAKAVSLILFVIAPAITGIVQLIDPNTPIMCLGLLLGTYYVYIDMMNLQIYNDALTGLNNRRRMESYVGDCIGAVSSDRPFYVFMIDVDYFKDINDTYGHVEGDNALRIAADALKKTAEKYHGFAARTGGDEFLLSIQDDHHIDPELIIITIKDSLNRLCEERAVPYRLNLSIGYAKCSSNQKTVNELLNEADEMQYERKQIHHQKLAER